MSEPPDGYSVPVYRSLTQRVLVVGVPKSWAVTLGMIAALLVPMVFLKPITFFFVVPIECALYALHWFAASKYRHEPYYFEVRQHNLGPRRLVP